MSARGSECGLPGIRLDRRIGIATLKEECPTRHGPARKSHTPEDARLINKARCNCLRRVCRYQRSSDMTWLGTVG